MQTVLAEYGIAIKTGRVFISNSTSVKKERSILKQQNLQKTAYLFQMITSMKTSYSSLNFTSHEKQRVFSMCNSTSDQKKRSIFKPQNLQKQPFFLK